MVNPISKCAYSAFGNVKAKANGSKAAIPLVAVRVLSRSVGNATSRVYTDRQLFSAADVIGWQKIVDDNLELRAKVSPRRTIR